MAPQYLQGSELAADGEQVSLWRWKETIYRQICQGRDWGWARVDLCSMISVITERCFMLMVGTWSQHCATSASTVAVTSIRLFLAFVKARKAGLISTAPEVSRVTMMESCTVSWFVLSSSFSLIWWLILSDDVVTDDLLRSGSFGLSLAFTNVTSASAREIVKLPSLRYLNPLHFLLSYGVWLINKIKLAIYGTCSTWLCMSCISGFVPLRYLS